MILQTNRLMLRPWMEEDAEELYRYAADPEVGPRAGWPVHTGVENSREIIRGVLSAPETYALVLKETGKIVGSIGLMIGKASNLGLPNDQAEVGYWIGKPHWGRGLVPEAVRELVCYGFQERKLEKIWCAWFDGNEKSRRVQEKCGFQYQYTRYNVPWPLIHATLTEHVSCLTRERWESML